MRVFQHSSRRHAEIADPGAKLRLQADRSALHLT